MSVRMIATSWLALSPARCSPTPPTGRRRRRRCCCTPSDYEDRARAAHGR